MSTRKLIMPLTWLIKPCHSRESGNPVKINLIWIPNQVGNDTYMVRNSTKNIVISTEAKRKEKSLDLLSFRRPEGGGIS